MRISGEAPCKVLILTATLHVGGVENLILDTAIEMKQRRKYLPLVCNLTGTGPLTTQFEKAGIDVFALTENKVLNMRLFPLATLRRMITEQSVSIIHMHQLYSGILGRIASLGLGVPTVYHTHNTTYNVGLLKQVTENFLTLTNTNVIIAVTAGMKDELLRRNPYASRKTRVLFNAVDARRLQNATDYDRNTFRSTLGIPGDVQHVIGAVGRLEEAKGFDLLLEVFADLQTIIPDTWLVIVGDGPLRNHLDAQANNLGINSQVTFTGFRSDIGALMAAFDLLVMPSRTEAFPLVALEAMHCGTPLIISDTVSAANLLSSAVTISKGLRPELTREVVRLLVSPELRMSQARRGKELAEREFSLVSYVTQTEDLYDELLAKEDTCASCHV